MLSALVLNYSNFLKNFLCGGAHGNETCIRLTFMDLSLAWKCALHTDIFTRARGSILSPGLLGSLGEDWYCPFQASHPSPTSQKCSHTSKTRFHVLPHLAFSSCSGTHKFVFDVGGSFLPRNSPEVRLCCSLTGGRAQPTTTTTTTTARIKSLSKAFKSRKDSRLGLCLIYLSFSFTFNFYPP